MLNIFIPDFYFDNYKKADASFLKSIGISCVFLDIDNTLEPYENPLPGEDVKAWLNSLKEEGISFAFISNNGKERVELFNSEIGALAYYKSKKPLKRTLLKALKVLGKGSDESLMMGDQIFTDVLAGKRMGMKTILLPPIKDKRDVFTRFKRLLEKPFLKIYKKREKKSL